MNRRDFLSLAGATAGALVLPDPRRVYSFPSTGWLARQSRILPGFTVTIRPGGYSFTVPGAQLRDPLEESIFQALSRRGADMTPGGIDDIKRTISGTLERYQAQINRAALGRVVIRGRVSV